jgi:general transcription factor 3C polypeptide 3 (transcription factor C subunit 4)
MHSEVRSNVLDYFLRAHALDPENPMINLSTGLAYVHLALKRQTDNRQHNILQGTTFLFRYYNARKSSVHIEERQEAHFNIARTYHMLGLTHLAIPYYNKVLSESSTNSGDWGQENLVIDTVYNLQTLYSTSRNLALAAKITKTWLII